MPIVRPITVSVALALLGAAAGVQSEARESAPLRATFFSIAQQPVRQALLQFAQQTGLQVVFKDVDAALDLTIAQPVSGELAPEAALKKMLEKTHLTYEFVTGRMVRISAPSPSSKGSSSSSETGDIDPKNPEAISYGEGSEERDSFSHVGASVQSAYTGTHAQSDSLEESQQVVITGTHIRGRSSSSSPLTVYNRDDIDQSGAATVEEFVRKIPQNFALIGSDTLNNSGTNLDAQSNVFFGSSLNLRGVGTGATLTLLNGHRISPAGNSGVFVDVSMIPLSAVERIDVLTDGASAIYGSDAVAGVVNFVLRKNYNGAETSLRYGDTSQGGAREFTASQLLGASWTTGNVFFSYERHDKNPLFANQRDFIPDIAGALMISPEQERDSAFLALEQKLSAQAGISVNAFFSKRDFINESFVGIRRHNEGYAKQYGGTIDVHYDLAKDWRVALINNMSRQNEWRESLVGTLAPSVAADETEVFSSELQADGSLFRAPGGDARVSVGTAYRQEKFDNLNPTSPLKGLQRNVFSLYAEVFVPLISGENGKRFAKSLELSLAGRFDDYDDFGSSTDPKIGILWSPFEGVKFRGTYATSFRAPPLAYLSDAADSVTILSIPEAGAPGGRTITLVRGSAGNSALQPEQAESFTLGLDYEPRALPGLSLSTTYYQIDYKDRIARPPLIGSLQTLYSQIAALSPFIQRDPTAAEVQQLIDSAFTVGNVARATPESVRAIFDFRNHNIAVSETAGIEFSANYRWDTAVGKLGVSLTGDYLLKSDYQSFASVPAVELLNTTYNPMDLRVRSVLSWSLRDVTTSLSVNYSNGYQNNLVDPVGEVASWTTADLYLRYRVSSRVSSVLDGFTFSVAAQNVTDKDPPYVQSLNTAFGDFGYDGANASPYGRLWSVAVSKRW